ncbi:MAG: ATP-binding protein [Gemmatimonadaceae bacterium]|nr:ATP-binding protein [Gemmatimonadaceae bacterium]
MSTTTPPARDGSTGDPARARRPVRIVVTGSESTGKTTLSETLAGTLGTLWVPEFSRQYAEQAGRALTAADVEPIARGQIAAEDAAIIAWQARFGTTAHASPLVFDTDLVSTTVYAEHYYGDCPPWILAAAGDRLADLYLLCEPDLPWMADRIRDRRDERRQLHAAFRARLQQLGAPGVRSITGSGAARLGRAGALVHAFLDERGPITG